MDNSSEGDLDNLSYRKQVLEAKIEQIRQALDDKRNKLAEADKEYQRVRKALAAATEQLMLNAEKEVFDDTVLQYFSINYGVQAKYHLTDRLHLTAELSGLTTFQQFDGHGTYDRLGDHKFDVSVGLSVNIGKVGFHKAKAQPVAYEVAYSPYYVYESTDQHRQPVNDNSGLNSLRARLAEAELTAFNNANSQTDSYLSAGCLCSDSVSIPFFMRACSSA